MNENNDNNDNKTKPKNERIPQPQDLAKEISDFLTQKFGGNIKIIPTVVVPDEVPIEKKEEPQQKKKINFSIKPEELTNYLDQYIVRQDEAKAILATKICTHFNRIKHMQDQEGNVIETVGRIKNNVLLIGPTGVGKTYMIKLIAKKIGVPFVKGDATKFSETGYVGGDVEDLVRDLYQEADYDLDMAQYGIIYIDEIDKIASSGNIIGHDISRAGVQRALLKPMEETDIDLKIAHDPISVMQEFEHFRKTGKREKRMLNTKNILFIMSGAFSDITKIIKERVAKQGLGFGANLTSISEEYKHLKQVKAEDLIKYGFESEFVGRLPVIAILEHLTEQDLYDIYRNPNNSTVLGKKLDFAAYGIDIKFQDEAFRMLAKQAYSEKTGARGLVSVIEKALLPMEKKLPSTSINRLCVTTSLVENPNGELKKLLETHQLSEWLELFNKLIKEEETNIAKYIEENKTLLSTKHELPLELSRINLLASVYSKGILDIDTLFKKVKTAREDVKKIESQFSQTHDIKISIEDDAIDFILGEHFNAGLTMDGFNKRLTRQFEYGLKLVKEKTGTKEFSLNREAFFKPDNYLDTLIKKTFQETNK